MYSCYVLSTYGYCRVRYGKKAAIQEMRRLGIQPVSVRMGWDGRERRHD